MTPRKLAIILSIIAILTLILIVSFSYSLTKEAIPVDRNNVKNTIRFEIIKSLLQLLVVIIIGSIITMLIKASENSREQSRLRAETWKDYLKRIGLVYQNVKRARRALTAGGLTTRYNNNPKVISMDHLNLYIEQMRIIDNAQIELEGLKIESENLPEFLSLNNVSKYLERAEDYLRQIVKEYEVIMPLINKNKSVEFKSLERLHEFTTSTKNKFFRFKKYTEKIDYRFEMHFANSFREIVGVFNQAFK
ncbi:MAG TPA: hypothetical protein VGQ53_07950 [Chitinophagaceae bacterium]|jgi:hypothetical protein|nr:hypothetical protein [Chitinophagaceae bacterium]